LKDFVLSLSKYFCICGIKHIGKSDLIKVNRNIGKGYSVSYRISLTFLDITVATKADLVQLSGKQTKTDDMKNAGHNTGNLMIYSSLSKTCHC
jgi:hypothetical protein